MSPKPISFFQFLLIICCFLFGCNNDSEHKNNPNEKHTKVKIQLDWTPGTEHSFLYLGCERGFFRNQGIDLEIIPGTNFGSSASATAVGAKAVDFALCSGETALGNRSLEISQELVVVANLYPTTPTVIYSLKSLKKKGITEPEDLLGKNIGVMKGSSAYKNYLFFLKKMKLDDSQIHEVPVTGNIEEILNENSKIDAMVHFAFQQPLMIQQRGIEVNEINLSKYVTVYGQSLITNKDLVEKNPNLIFRFTKAFQKSLLETMRNPDEALRIFSKQFIVQDHKYAMAKLERVNNFIKSGSFPDKPIGFQTQERWDATKEYLENSKFLPREPLRQSFWTNDFLDPTALIK